VHPHAPAALFPAKDPRYSLDKRLDSLQNRSGHCGEEKNLLRLRKSNFGGPANNINFFCISNLLRFSPKDHESKYSN
jgi:hypothetical protein